MKTDNAPWEDLSVQDILERAIADEEGVRDYYRRAATKAGNAHVGSAHPSFRKRTGHADTLRKS